MRHRSWEFIIYPGHRRSRLPVTKEAGRACQGLAASAGGTRARPGTAANLLTCDEARRIAALTVVHRESLVDS